MWTLNVVVFAAFDELLSALIPFVVVGIWLLSQVLKKANQPPQPGPRAQGPGGPPAGGGQVVWRTPKEEIERFLQDVRRRQQQPEPAAERVRTERAPADRAQPRVAAGAQRPKRRAMPEAEREEGAVGKESAVLGGAGQSIRSGGVRISDAGVPPATAVRQQISGASAPAAAEGAARAAGLGALLGSRAGMRQAVLVSEIFSPPVSERPPR